ncbi:MAG: hypothetical protein QM478_02955 [Flavobacteriaceae bacterium]
MSLYFGIIKKNEFTQLTKKEQNDYLVAKGAFQFKSIYKAKHNGSEYFLDLGKVKTVLELSNATIEAFYSYILEKHDQKIKANFVTFFRDFSETVFGLEKAEQRKIALQYFKEIYAQINNPSVDLFSRKKAKGLVEEVNVINRFEKLYHMRKGKKINLCSLSVAIEYFYGNDEYLSSLDFINQDSYTDAINFELGLKVLVNLNDRYHFEDDLYFSEYGALKKTFENYQHIFHSIEVFEFTHKKIQSFKDKAPAHITSLYDALNQMNLIHKKKSAFITYVNAEYGKGITSMKFYEKGRSTERDQRVESFTQELSKYAVK